MNLDGKYYYYEDKYCFYICHDSFKGFRIPLQKESGLYILSHKAVKSMVDDLNQHDFYLFLDMVLVYEDLKKRGF